LAGTNNQQFSIWLCWIAKSSQNSFGFGNPGEQKRLFFLKMRIADK
jgi:hypothetical protein